MKKYFCCFLSLVILFSFYGCGGSISKSEAENIIKGEFPNRDKDGVPYRTIDCYVSNVSVDFIYDLVKKGNLKLTKDEKNGGGDIVRHEYGVASETDCKGVRAIVVVQGWGFPVSDSGFRDLPLIKEYFLGVQETWRDKRQGYEGRVHATYKTKFSLTESCYALVKDTKGRLDPTQFAVKQYTNAYRDLSLSEYISKMEIGTIKSRERTFEKDSKGNWQ